MEIPERRNDLIGMSAYPDTISADRPLNIPLDTPVNTWSWPAGTSITPPGGSDPDNWTVVLSSGVTLRIPRKLPSPALAQLFWNSKNSNPGDAPGTYGTAEMLYRIISIGSPEAMEQFNRSEIGDTDSDGCPEFIDGWGRPIYFLRWAPGYSTLSKIQAPDPTNNHDPFDTRGIDAFAYRLIPLIYSGGPSIDAGLDVGETYQYDGQMFTRPEFLAIGAPVAGSGAAGNITNHNMEQR